jgi:CAAX prenyl protease-like protein
MPSERTTPATAAHVAPFVVFMVLTLVPGWLRVENSELPWFQRAPEHWLYPLQTVVCAALLWIYRRQYQLAPWRGLPLALGLGVLGFALWVGPAWWFERVGGQVPKGLEWLGFVERRVGFDPTVLEASQWQWVAVGMRFVRMVVVVPLVEEIFWRGFLMRFLAAEGEAWTRVPFGTHRWRVFWIVSLLVMVAHQPEDYAAAFIWGTLVYYVTVRTRSLGACVLMHALCNLLLGLYVMRTGQWGFW